MLGLSLTVLTGQVLMFRVPMRPAETFCGLAVTLADEHLAFIVLAWKRWTQNVNAIVLLLRSPQTKWRMWNGGGVLTAAGDLPVGLIAAVVVKFSVGVVQDGPALGMLHGIAVTLVVHLAAPLTVIAPHFWYWLHSCTIGNRRTGVLTCPDRPRGCRSLRNRSSSRSRHSPRLASYRASHTGSFFWTGWGPGSPATGLKGRKQLESQTLSKGRFPNVGRFPHRQKDSQPRGTQSGEYSSFSLSRGSAHLNIFLYQVWDFGTAPSAIHTTRRHTHSKVHTYSPRPHLNLGFWFCVDYSGLEEHQGRKHNIKKWPWA